MLSTSTGLNQHIPSLDTSYKDRFLACAVGALKAASEEHRARAKDLASSSDRPRGNASEDARTDLEDITAAAEYLFEEVESEGILLPSPRRVEDDGIPSTQYDLLSLESHALYSLVRINLSEMLAFEEDEATKASPWVVEGILLGLEKSTEVADPDDRRQHRRGTLDHCDLCTRYMPLTAHHLIPKSEHARLQRLPSPPFTIHEMRTRFAWLCRPCHSAIHKLVSSRAMADEYHTLRKLEEVEAVRKWAKYASGLKERSDGYAGFGLQNKR